LDEAGFLYIMAGEEFINGQFRPANDVWRSTYSFNDPATISRMCNVSQPICGIGLVCLPGSNTRIENGRVRCPATDACTSSRLSFSVLTATAQWTQRHSAGLESAKTSFRLGTTLYPIGSLVLYGGVGLNSVTGNPDALLTDTWVSIDGREWQRQSSTGLVGSAFSGHSIDSKGRLYKVGGERWDVSPSYVHGEVFMSANNGATWTKQVPTIATKALPKRAFPDVYPDSLDRLYAVGGLDGPGGDGLNDVWMSSNQGRDWNRQGAIPFAQPGGRSSGALLIHKSKLLSQKDVLIYMGGYSRAGSASRFHNVSLSSSFLVPLVFLFFSLSLFLVDVL